MLACRAKPTFLVALSWDKDDALVFSMLRFDIIVDIIGGLLVLGYSCGCRSWNLEVEIQAEEWIAGHFFQIEKLDRSLQIFKKRKERTLRNCRRKAR